MDFQLGLYLVIGAIIGFAIGWILTNVFSSKSKKYNKVKKELEQTKLELNTQKQMIVKHFSHSAEILDKMATDFRKLYKHMADNSSSFLTEEEMNKALASKEPEDAETVLITNDKEDDETVKSEAKPNSEAPVSEASSKTEEEETSDSKETKTK